MTAPTNQYFLHLLGDFRLTDQEGKRLIGPGKPLSVLAFLALSARRRSTRRVLGRLLWPESEESRAQSSLRQAIFWLRRRIGAEAVLDEGGFLVLAPHVVVDVDELIRSLDARDPQAVCSAYRGRLMQSFDVRESDEFTDWLAQQQATLGRRLTAGITTILSIDRVVSAEVRLALTAIVVEAAPDDDENWRLRFQALLASSQFGTLEAEGAALRAARAAEDRRLHPDLLAILSEAREREAGAPSEGASHASALPFTGRLEELDMLKGMLRRTLNGEVRLAEIIAPPGYGKSRLLDAFFSVAIEAAAEVVLLRVPITDRQEPLAFMAVLARRLTELPGAAGISPESSRLLTDLVEGLAPEPRDHLHVRRLAAAAVDLLSAVCEESPLVFLIDDVDAIDRESRDVWQRVKRNLPAIALCLVETSAESGAFGGERSTRVALPRLADADLAPLLEAIDAAPVVDGAASNTRALPTQLLRESEGVPRSLEQLLTLGMDTGVLTHVGGRWHMAAEADVASITLGAVSRALYSRLNDTERDVLASLTCSGGAVTTAVIGELLGLPSGRAFDALCQLRTAGIVVCQDADRWDVAHSGVGAVAAADTERMVRVAALCGEHMSRTASNSAQQQHALRLLLLGQREALVRELAFDWISALERTGIPARIAAQQVVPEEAGAALSRDILRQVEEVRRRNGLFRLVLFAVVSCCAILPWVWLSRPAQIVSVSQIDPASIDYADMPFEVFPRFEIRTRRGTRSRARDGDTAWARSTFPGALVRGRTSAIIRDGLIVFDSLYPPAFASGAVAHDLEIAVAGLPSLVLRVKDERATLKLVTGIVNGRRFDGGIPHVEVAPSGDITATFRWRYSTQASTASYQMGYATSWEPLAQSTHTSRALLVGVRDAEFVDSFRQRAPRKPGHYWVVWTLGSEPDPKWLLSGTNWVCGTPRWNDGNDVQMLPDSVLRQSAIRGHVEIPYDYCDAGAHQRRMVPLPLAAVEITVR